MEGDDVITHDWRDRFAIEDGEKIILTGQEKGDSCLFTVALENTPDGSPKIARELAVKPSTCELLIEKGTLSAEGKRVIDDETSRADGSGASIQPTPRETQRDTRKGGLQLPSASGLPSNTAWHKVIWEDPVQLDVNWVESRVEWEYDAPHARVYYVNGLSSSYWYTPSGWVRDLNYSNSEWYYLDNQERVAVETAEHFSDDIFCDLFHNDPLTNFPPDHAYYPDIKIVGSWTGGYWFQSNSTVSDPCSWLLHKEYVTGSEN